MWKFSSSPKKRWEEITSSPSPNWPMSLSQLFLTKPWPKIFTELTLLAEFDYHLDLLSFLMILDFLCPCMCWCWCLVSFWKSFRKASILVMALTTKSKQSLKLIIFHTFVSHATAKNTDQNENKTKHLKGSLTPKTRFFPHMWIWYKWG